MVFSRDDDALNPSAAILEVQVQDNQCKENGRKDKGDDVEVRFSGEPHQIKLHVASPRRLHNACQRQVYRSAGGNLIQEWVRFELGREAQLRFLQRDSVQTCE